LFVGGEGKLVIVQSHVRWNNEAMNLLGDTLDTFVVLQNLIFDINNIIILMKLQLKVFHSELLMEVFDNVFGTDKIYSFLIIRFQSSIDLSNILRASVEQIGPTIIGISANFAAGIASLIVSLNRRQQVTPLCYI